MKFLISLALLFSLHTNSAEDFSYSGRLVHTNGAPVSGPVNLKFELSYTNDPATILCEKDINNVPLSNGLFNVRLTLNAADCSGNEPQVIFMNTPVGHNVAIRVTDLTNTKTYGHQAIYNVPAASFAQTAKTLTQMGATPGQILSWNGTQWAPTNPAAATGSVTEINTSSGLSGGPITSTGTISIAPGGVTSTHIANGTISNDDISPSADIARSKLANGANNVVLTNNSSGFYTELASLPISLGGTGATNLNDARTNLGIGSSASYDFVACLPGQYSYFVTPGGWACAYDDDVDEDKLALTGGTLSGALAMSNNKITGLAAPTDATDAATKTYVDTAISGVSSGSSQWTTAGSDIYFDTGKVGINTSSLSEFSLTVNDNADSDSGIMARGSFGSGATLGTTGAGTRNFWYPRKAAFRAGHVSSNQWDNANIGNYSAAFGLSTIASGPNSFAAGNAVIASGNYSAAFGWGNTTASGQASFAAGNGAIASGQSAISMGTSTSAAGTYGVALGGGTSSSGGYSVAIGTFLTATNGAYLFGQGADNSNRLSNSAANSIAFGMNSTIPTLFVGPSTGAGTTGNVGIGTVSPATKFDVNGSLKIGNGGETCNGTIPGAIRYNSGAVEFCNGTAWTALGASGGATPGDNTVTSAKIVDGTIVNADVSASANIDASKLGTGAVSNTEFNYLDGVTSAIQTQLTGKISKAGDTISSGTLTFNGTGVLAIANAPVNLTDAVNKSYVDNAVSAGGSKWVTSGTNISNGNTGNVGLGTTTPGTNTKLRVEGQVASKSFSQATGTINWVNGNAGTTSFDCGSNITFANMRDGGSYTLAVTGTGTAACNFSTTTTGDDAATVSYRFVPTNGARTATSHTIYSFQRIGTVVYISWISGF